MKFHKKKHSKYVDVNNTKTNINYEHLILETCTSSPRVSLLYLVLMRMPQQVA